nr:MAG TPA: hypothetical protein [Caudoviricetes sp.]
MVLSSTLLKFFTFQSTLFCIYNRLLRLHFNPTMFQTCLSFNILVHFIRYTR